MPEFLFLLKGLSESSSKITLELTYLGKILPLVLDLR